MAAAAQDLTPDVTVDPTSILVELILAFLTPLFLIGAGGNLDHARLAAAHTLDTYRARTDSDIILVAQIIAFGLTALASLSLSMTDGLSLSMILRLRGSAQGSSRAADQNRRALKESHPIVVPDEPSRSASTPPEPALDEAKVIAAVAAATQHAAEVRAEIAQQAQQPRVVPRTPNEQVQALWADAFTDVANEIAAEIPGLPLAERKIAKMRATALSSSAHQLLAGDVPPRLRPGDRSFG